MLDTLQDEKPLILPPISVDVFALTPQTSAAVESAGQDRRLTKVRWKHREGGIPGATSLYRTDPSPNLLILESEAPPETLFTELEALAEECEPTTKVLVVAPANDVTFFRELLARGVTDLLVTPVSPRNVISALQRAYEDEAEPKLGRVTAFIGARGGVGSSTVAHNVAVAIGKWLDTDVLLADLDLQFGTVGLDFDVDGSYGMNDVLRGAERLDDLLLERMALKYDEHIQILAAETSLERTADLHGGAVERLLDVAHSSARHVILDIPRIWTRRSKKALISADEIVITATPDLTSLRNVKQMLEFFRQQRLHDPMPLLVLNQVGQPRKPEISPEDFASAVRLEPGPQVPFNAALFGKALNNGQVIVEFAERSAVARTFLEIGRYVDGYKHARSNPTLSRKIARALKRWW